MLSTYPAHSTHEANSFDDIPFVIRVSDLSCATGESQEQSGKQQVRQKSRTEEKRREMMKSKSACSAESLIEPVLFIDRTG